MPFTELIIVCCHGIWLSGPSRGTDEKEWLIAPFQVGETPTFISHLVAGVRTLQAQPSALLVLSGGPTRRETQRSEARSYQLLAEAYDYWSILGPDGRDRVLLDERALDSFHNVLFSLTRFYEVTHTSPQHVTIISNEFKRPRFLELHMPALRWPAERVRFIGIDPPYMARDEVRARGVREGERRNGFEAWERDGRGVGSFLKGKRMGRNPWEVGQGLFGGDDDGSLREESKLHWELVDGIETLGVGKQPWEM